MELRRFEAPTLQEALDTVKRELGPEAVIVQTRKNTKAYGLMSGPSFEVTAARSLSPGSSMENSREFESLIQEVRSLRRMVEDLQTRQEQMRQPLEWGDHLTSEMQEVFQELLLQGVERHFVMTAISKSSEARLAEPNATFEDLRNKVVDELMDQLPVQSLFDGVVAGSGHSSQIVFIGAAGAGKTTTLAKIASQAIQRQLRVGLISIQWGDSSSFEQLGTLAKVLHVPFRMARTAGDLEVSLRDFQTLDLTLIDTSGFTYRDAESFQRLSALFQTAPQLKSLLIFSASTRDSELYQMAAHYSNFSPAGVVFTKLDESSFRGNLVNLPQRLKLPLMGLSTGQKIPSDYVEASKSHLSSLLLGDSGQIWKNLPAAN